MTPDMPLLAADIIAQRLQTPQASPEFQQEKSDDTETKPLLQRMAKGAAKYADILTRPAEMMPDYQSKVDDNARHANAESPHLLPSPSKPAPSSTGSHLGWSDLAKSSFDRAKGVIHIPMKTRAPSIQHVVGPARPLDERHTGDDSEDDETPADTSRRPSFFGDFVESWREGKKERRREELKRIIRVVPVEGQNDGRAERPQLVRDTGSGGSQAVSSSSVTPLSEKESPFVAMGRRLSGYNWM